MMSKKIPVIICCCLMCSAHSMVRVSPISTDSRQSSTLNTLPDSGNRQSFDTLSFEVQAAVFEAIDSVTFAKGPCRSEVISNGFIVSDIKNTINGVVIRDREMRVYFPSVTAYSVAVGKDGISEFRPFHVSSITIMNIGQKNRQVILNQDIQLQLRKKREFADESQF